MYSKVTPLYHWLHSIRHMHVSLSISLLQNPTWGRSFNAKSSKSKVKVKAKAPTPISFSRAPNGQQNSSLPSIGAVVVVVVVKREKRKQENAQRQTPPTTSSQDIVLLEDERFVIAVVFVDLLVFFFDFALGLAVLFRADLFGDALC